MLKTKKSGFKNGKNVVISSEFRKSEEGIISIIKLMLSISRLL